MRVEFCCNRLRVLGNGAVLTAAGAVCLWWLGSDEPVVRAFGVAGLAVIGYALVALGRVLFVRGPVTVIDDAGIRDRSMGYGLIPWIDVDEIYLTESRHSMVLSVCCENPEIYLARLPFYRRALARLSARKSSDRVRISFTLLWRQGMAQGACPTCGHDLHATRSRCPECGTSVARMMARRLQFKELPGGEVVV